MRGAKVLHGVYHDYENFTAFHVGMHRHRPGFRTPVRGLYLAGDWVKLPYPAMLMEAACTSGLLCANAIMAQETLQPEPIFTVPERGLLA